MYVYGSDGQQYLDFSSQNVYTNLGHQHKKVTSVVADQLGRLSQMASHTTRQMQDAAAYMVRKLVGEHVYSHVHFATSGTDAVENAIRIARTVSGRTKILSSYTSYHGSSGTALAASGDKRRNLAPQLPGHVHFHSPYLFRSPFMASTHEEETRRALHHLKCTIEAEGPDTIAAILFEPIQGAGGVLVPPPWYIEGLCNMASDYDILVIFDETMTGFGRTGKEFAYMHHEYVTPDIIVMGKAMTNGVVPCGAVAVTAPIADQLNYKVPGGQTFCAHPLLLAATIGTVDAMLEENIVANAHEVGRYLGDKLHNFIMGEAINERYMHYCVGDVRGRGLMWCLELIGNVHTKEPVSKENMDLLVKMLFDRGLLVFNAKNRIHLVPPLIATKSDVDVAFGILDETLHAWEQVI